MHILQKQRCRVCGCPHLKPVIDLGPQYLQGSFVKEGYPAPPLRKIPTQLVRCDTSKEETACGPLQLAHSIPPEILYANYWYRSGTNQTMRDHLAGIMASVLEIVKPAQKRVLDIGCNDGTGLRAVPAEFERWGVDPSNIASQVEPPIKVINTVFPSAETKHRFAGLKFDFITSIAMYYDLEDPVAFAREIESLLDENGVWVLEMSYMPLMLATNSFDTICHEHLEYYSLSVLNTIMAAAGLKVFRTELNAINGGSIRCYVCKSGCFEYKRGEWRDFMQALLVREFEMALETDEPYQDFQQRIAGLRDEMTRLLDDIRARGETVHIYGASTKGNVLLQWYGIDAGRIPLAADRNIDKVGARTLGTGIEIISEEASRAARPDYYLVLPWHFRDEFLKRERETILAGTKMIFPLPTIEVIGADNLEAGVTAGRTPEMDRFAEFA